MAGFFPVGLRGSQANRQCNNGRICPKKGQWNHEGYVKMFSKNGIQTNNLLAFHLSLFIVSIYLISYSFIWTEYFLHRFEDTKSLVDNLDFSISTLKSTGVIGIDGRIYSIHGLGWPVLAAPFYLVGKPTC